MDKIITTTERKIYTVHVYPHVRKFMLKTYPHSNGTFRSEEYYTWGRLVTFSLIDKRKPQSQNDQVRDRLHASIKIEVTKEQLQRSPRGFKLDRLNIYMDSLFKEMLLQWIRAQEYEGKPVHASCKAFLEFYNLDETEYSLDSAYKYWQRHNKK